MSEPLTAEQVDVLRDTYRAVPTSSLLTERLLATIDNLTARLAVKERACKRLAAGGPPECRMSCRWVKRESCSVLLRFGVKTREECIARRIAWAEEK